MSDIESLQYLSGQLRQGAQKFSSAAQTLQRQAQRLDWSAQDLASGASAWAGQGSQNFTTSWNTYHQSTQRAATAMDNTSLALTRLAQKIDDTVAQLQQQQAQQSAMAIGMGVLTVGLVVVDVLQLGLDPVTDGLTVAAGSADAAAITGTEAAAGGAEVAAQGLVEADAEIAGDLDEIANGIDNVADSGDIGADGGGTPGDINVDDGPFGDGGGTSSDGGSSGDGGSGGNDGNGTGDGEPEDGGINDLKNTSNFRPGSLNHIFEGDLKGTNAGGYHYEGISNTPGSTIPGTETLPNEDGVYEAQVKVNGVSKTANGGYSTFFPKSMSPQEVVDNINEAYNSRSSVPGTRNTYVGQTSSGITILMYLDNASQIISAFPEY